MTDYKSDHKEIYLQPECCACEHTGRMWCEDPDPEECEDGVPWTKYVRADLYEGAQHALRDHHKLINRSREALIRAWADAPVQASPLAKML